MCEGRERSVCVFVIVSPCVRRSDIPNAVM